jgi:hypothetical protein
MAVWKLRVVMLKLRWSWLRLRKAIEMVTSAVGEQEIPVAYLLGEQYIKAMQAKSNNAKTVVLLPIFSILFVV